MQVFLYNKVYEYRDSTFTTLNRFQRVSLSYLIDIRPFRVMFLGLFKVLYRLDRRFSVTSSMSCLIELLKPILIN